MAWGTTSIKSIPQIRTYEAAEQFFNCSRERRSKYYAPNERPLTGNTAHHNSKIVKYGDGYHYAFRLYNTAVVTYDRPQEDGMRRVALRFGGYETQSTRMFMDALGWWHGMSLITTDGRNVKLPLFGPGAILWFDKDKHLDTSLSTHTPWGTRATSGARKQDRNNAAKLLRPVVMSIVLGNEGDFRKDRRIVSVNGMTERVQAILDAVRKGTLEAKHTYWMNEQFRIVRPNWRQWREQDRDPRPLSTMVNDFTLRFIDASHPLEDIVKRGPDWPSELPRRICSASNT